MAGYADARAAFPVVRQSALAAFDSCALSSFFDQTFVEYHSHPQGRGSVFHATVAECLRTMVTHGNTTIDVDLAYTILEEQLRQADAAPADFLPVSLDQIAELRITVKKWATDNAFSVQNIVGIEDRYTITVQYDDPAEGTVDRKLTGQLDLLLIDENNDAIVIDWKDTWGLPGPSEISEGGFFQQRFYAMLVFVAYPAVQTVTLREFYPRYSETREAILWREELPNLIAEFSALVERHDRAWQAHIDEERRMAEAADAAITDDGHRVVVVEELPMVTDAPSFPPTPGHHCGYCPMPERCPILPSARGPGALVTMADAELAAAQLLVARAVAKKLGDAMRVFVRHNGPIKIKDAKRPRVFGFVERQTTRKPTQDQLQAALDAADSDADREQIIADLFKTTTGTTFKDYVPDSEER